MKIHFVCKGNAYRSRLAEAYFNSKRLKGFSATSSGTDANHYRPTNGPISIYAKGLLEKENILQYTTKDVTLTTRRILEEQDYIIFMDQVHYDFCVNLGFKPKNYEIWYIKDVDEILGGDYRNKVEVNKVAAKTYEFIKYKVDELITKIEEGDLIAV